ncbi:MAG: hypothetical protein K1X67_24880 [Fimbriimonadaceae bacterium]|nr:hypothetical protein [Fimbriimonadaceae bacterium]
MNSLSKLIFALVAAASVSQAWAQVNSYSDGSDGAFNPSAGLTTIDLGLAPTTSWTSPGTGNGVYDPSKWAVVFKYSSVNIDAGKTVKFTNHPKTPPVVWLVQGDVTINGIVDLDGGYGPSNTGQFGIPGPGGFRGGSFAVGGNNVTAGFGPGGSSNVNGHSTGEGGSYGTAPTLGQAAGKGPVYGNAQILPLIGGSGSKARVHDGYGGFGGGGAILIVASGNITINGTIRANSYDIGGAWCGSGGAVRLVANRVTGTGIVQAVASTGYGGNGRIRIERLDAGSTFSGGVSPTPSSIVLTGPEPVIWPTNTHPTLAVTSVDGVSVPADPASNFNAPDLQIGPAATSVVRLEAANVPTDGSWRVQVRVVPRNGVDSFANATLVSGNQVASIWEATVTLPQGGAAVTARAYKL